MPNSNVCKFLASDGVIFQSVTKPFFKTPVFGAPLTSFVLYACIFQGHNSKKRCLDNSVSTDNSNASSSTSVEEPSDLRIKRISGCETVTHWAAVPPIQTAGHTGYLTWASLCSSS